MYMYIVYAYICIFFVVSHYYGFGLLNADAMIKAAKNWTLVSQQIECTESSTDTR